MRKRIFNMFTLAFMGLAIAGCKNKLAEATASNAETAMTVAQEGDKYTAIIGESTIEWQGFKPTGSHKGTINIVSGEFNLTNGKISGGSFIIDMNSIEESENNERLKGHLKSADFFEVDKYPTASFQITSIEDKDGHTVLSGNLTLKDATNMVSIPVTVSNDANVLKISSEVFTIDRSKWNVKYGSKSFFDDLKDKFINDDIELKIAVTANRSM